MPQKKGAGTRKAARDARTGRFVPLQETKRRPSTTVVETIKPKRKGSSERRIAEDRGGLVDPSVSPRLRCRRRRP